MKSVAALAALTAVMLTSMGTGVAQIDLNRTLDEWARTKQVGITSAVRSELKAEAQRAVDAVHEQSPAISRARLWELVPKAVVLYLDNTQSDGQPASLADLLQDLAVPKLWQDAISPIGPTNIHPILTIEITPATPKDFVVAIDGDSFEGLIVFRVPAGNRNVRVTRTNRPPCVMTVTVTRTGPNRVACSM